MPSSFLAVFITFLLFGDSGQAAVTPKPGTLTQEGGNGTLSSIQSGNALITNFSNPSLNWHVPHTSINIFFNAHGDRLSLVDLSGCLFQAGYWAVNHVLHHDDTPMFTAVFRRDTVYLKVWPIRMSKLTFAQIIGGVGEAILDAGWTYASHITAADPRFGVLGYLDITYGPSAADTKNDSEKQVMRLHGTSGSTTSSTPSNTGVTAQRPSDPLRISLADDKWVLLSGFGKDIPTAAVLGVILEAQNSVIQILAETGSTAIIRTVQEWRHDGIKFQVFPFTMRLPDIEQLIHGLSSEILSYHGFEFNFELFRGGSKASHSRTSLGMGWIKAID